jgi:hypothetical protein
VSFLQAGVDNAPLNTILEFRFSEAVDVSSISPASLQIREGSAFGLTVPGTFRVVGSTVYFEPRLPGLCDFSDSGFQPDKQYRVTLVGYPEQFRIKNTHGQPLASTMTFEFRTLPDTDPLLFTDQVPATPPSVIATTPTNGTAAATVVFGNQVVLDISENLRPCSVSDLTVRFHEYQRGDPTRFQQVTTVNPTGFAPGVDSDPSPFSWGPIDAGETNLPTTLGAPQKIRATIQLVQSFTGTQLILTPEFGQFPENALIVVALSFEIKDFGGASMVPFTFAFTTENKVAQNGTRVIEWEGETPIIPPQTTADVNTARAPSLAQGYLLFAGDGDNGANQNQPSLPNTAATLCTLPLQLNNAVKDDFDPADEPSGVLDTGLTLNTCPNSTDGSTAVIWEFQSFRVRNGRTVRIKGVNPAIILVSGDVVIEAGGRVLVRGDNSFTTPNSVGVNGVSYPTAGYNVDASGGVGVAGGGNGGSAYGIAGATPSQDGAAGFGSPNQFVVGGLGSGQGNAKANGTTFTGNGSSPSGGGGGHSVVGIAGTANQPAGDPATAPTRGAAGGVYPTVGTALAIRQMRKPSSGSGGGGAGHNSVQANTQYYGSRGGSGGAGGGFVDFTSAGNITIFGTVDAAGGRGGNGAGGFYTGSGGGGGGSGGGLRFLTPLDINITGAVITAAGGAGGTGAISTGQPAAGAQPNHGGAGAVGRVVFEDGDSVITGIGSAAILPADGAPGFYRGPFDATRFQGGGLTPTVVTDLFFAGPANPVYQSPVQNYGVSEDFVVGIPALANRGPGAAGIRIEVRGFELGTDGLPVAAAPGYRTIGWFGYNGLPGSPTWNLGQPSALDVGPPPADNIGTGLGDVAGKEFLQLRITFFLPPTIGPFDGGPFMDRWTIRFTYDQ